MSTAPKLPRAEFVEIKNTGAAPANLDPIALVLVNGTGGAVYQTIDLPAVTLGPGEYFVVCGNAATTLRCDLDVSPDTNLLQNGAPDAVALVSGGTILDAVSYEGDTVAPYTEGSGVGLDDDSTLPFLGLSRFPDGTDTNANNVDLSPRCITPGAAWGSAGPTSETRTNSALESPVRAKSMRHGPPGHCRTTLNATPSSLTNTTKGSSTSPARAPTS